ncbi:hypothetical protein F4561_006468 [Lipingzhangella halophila]|uniref:Uncharacterized protein n=1 Tax=Lipingzhangella halophila TaxID=1783352 RepID=A0A7W7RP30_9ACTN|nr:hypothetical protein [Lipingzhangella halophila]MBB4935574.1 hypothetical protein [Lipingzhangella halophila]
MRTSRVERIARFTFQWPEYVERFDCGWQFQLHVGGATHTVQHGLGARKVYGRLRVHTVTWIGGQVQVEGTEADDYPNTRALLSRLRYQDKKLIRKRDDVPAEYHGFELVEHRHEIDAQYSPNCIAVKIREDDLASWGMHAWLRMCRRS